MNGLAFGTGNVFKCANERTESEVTYFAAPEAFHTLNIEVFQDDGIEPVGQVVGGLELPVTALVGNLFVRLRELVFGFLAIARSILFARQGTILSGNVVQRALEEFRCSNVIGGIYSGQELFQTKVETRHVTGRDINLRKVIVSLYREAKPEVAALVAFHRHCFYVAVDRAGLAKLIHSAIDANLVAAKQFPTTLLKREGLVLLDFFEAWASILATSFTLLGLKKYLVRTVQTFNNILYRLGIDHAPERILGQLLEFGDVLHQRVLGYVLARQLEVPPLQRNTMIPNNARNINALVKMPILFVAVEFVLEGLAHEEPIENTRSGNEFEVRRQTVRSGCSISYYIVIRFVFARTGIAHFF